MLSIVDTFSFNSKPFQLSGSMNNNIQACKDAISAFSSSLSSQGVDAKFAIVGYDGGTEILQRLGTDVETIASLNIVCTGNCATAQGGPRDTQFQFNHNTGNEPTLEV